MTAPASPTPEVAVTREDREMWAEWMAASCLGPDHAIIQQIRDGLEDDSGPILLARYRHRLAASTPASGSGVVEALQWYAEQVAGCRKIGSAGDVFRAALDHDGGRRAREALALPADQPPAGEVDPLAWLASDTRLSLYHYSPMYGDDDDQSEEWRVARESGPINDREWEVVGRGPTPTDAILSTLSRGGR